MMMSTPDTNLLAPAPGCNNPGGEGWRHLPRGENCSQDDPIIKLPQPGKFLSRVENQKRDSLFSAAVESSHDD